VNPNKVEAHTERKSVLEEATGVGDSRALEGDRFPMHNDGGEYYFLWGTTQTRCWRG